MDKVGICNIAIGNLGISQFIGDLLTEQSNEARVCRIYYDQALKKTLESIPWKFATSLVDLQDIGSPPAKWLYRYRYPTNCVFARAVSVRDAFLPEPQTYFDANVLRFINRDYFEIIEDEAADGLAICCNIPEAQLCFTRLITKPVLFSALFVDTFAWCLSTYIATPLSAAPNMAQLAGQAFKNALLEAAARSMNEGKEPLRTDQDSEFILARY